MKLSLQTALMMKVFGKAILFASMQFAIGSVEMSSKFSVKNFSKDQETLNNAVDALADYIMIGIFWTLGTSMIFVANYGMTGLVANVVANVAIILWIYLSYQNAFNAAAKQHGLVVPPLFRNAWLIF